MKVDDAVARSVRVKGGWVEGHRVEAVNLVLNTIGEKWVMQSR